MPNKTNAKPPLSRVLFWLFQWLLQKFVLVIALILLVVSLIYGMFVVFNFIEHTGTEPSSDLPPLPIHKSSTLNPPTFAVLHVLRPVGKVLRTYPAEESRLAFYLWTHFHRCAACGSSSRPVSG